MSDETTRREKLYQSCFWLILAICFVFPFVAPIVAAILMSGTGLPSVAAEKWAHSVLKVAGVSTGLLVVWALGWVIRNVWTAG